MLQLLPYKKREDFGCLNLFFVDDVVDDEDDGAAAAANSGLRCREIKVALRCSSLLRPSH